MPVVFIAYNSTTTGSKALRSLNNAPDMQDLLYGSEHQNMTKEYCRLYDVGKKNEPFYDVLASQIACSNTHTFDSYFQYVPIKLTSSGSEYDNFNFSKSDKQTDPLVFTMESTMYKGHSTVTRDYFEKDLNYYNGEHIFIYGPITDIIFNKIIIKTHQTKKSNLFIHLQGENILNNQGADGDTLFGMESKGNLFNNSFNYQNHMDNANKLRNYIESTNNCLSFTVVCNQDSHYVKEYKGEPVRFPINTGDVVKLGYPKIYDLFYNHIVELINGTYDFNFIYQRLYITDVYQDMTDKDNITSIVYLILHSVNHYDMDVFLIGKEHFKLFYGSEEVPHYNLINFAKFPEKFKPNISEHKNIELNMGASSAKYWPDFKDSNYRLEYDDFMTKKLYVLTCELVKIVINDLLMWYKVSFDKFIVLPDHLIPDPSCDKSNTLALFNEILYFPVVNTYLQAINTVDRKVGRFDLTASINPIFTNVISSDTYLNNYQLCGL